MNSYTDFAYVYDLFMDNVPYVGWADRVCSLLTEYDELEVPEGDEALASEAGLLLDLGCGTGVFTRLMSDRGYDCIGVDSSEQMLEVAMQKEAGREGDDGRILYLLQDMRELELYSTVGAVVSICDCINYLLSPDDVLKTFESVNNYLYPRGLFIFDFNTVHYYRDVLGDDVIAENRPEGSFIWENYYDEETGINECDLTIYAASDMETGDGHENAPLTYVRSEETHEQRGYDADEITDLLIRAGMKIVRVFDSDTDGEVTDVTSRVCIVARESGK